LAPWYIKIPAKMVLSRLPFSHQTMFKLGIFKHGTMQQFDYAAGVFNRHLQFAGFSDSITAKNKTILELGPGESLYTALFAKSYGFEKTYLVDVGAFALPKITDYQQLAQWISNQGGNNILIDECHSIESMLTKVNAEYLTHGLASMKDIADESIDYIFSHAVLEHVRKKDFAETIAESYRILKPGGICTHAVDYKDHLGGAINNMRFSQKFWEADWVAGSGFYTNRIRVSEMKQLFEKQGFSVIILEQGKWDKLPFSRESVHTQFSDIPNSDLQTYSTSFLLTK
jgi:SAM-dependent methyltransferase